MSAVISNAENPADSSAVDENAPTTLEDNASSADTLLNDQLVLSAQLNEARETLSRLSEELRGVDAELGAISNERNQHRLLLEVCTAFEALSASGGAKLFWDDHFAADAGAEHMHRVRSRMDQFSALVADIEARRQAVVDRIKEQQHHADLFEDGLFEALEEEERRNQEWIIEREISALPARKSELLWTRGGEDDRRFRKSWSTALLVCLLIAIIFPLVTLPLRDRDAAEIPDRVVQLLVQSRPKPTPPPAPKEIKPKEQKAEEEKVVKETRQKKPEETVAPEEPQKPQGILAFREKFAELKDDEVVARLGSQATINDAGNSAGRPERAMLTTNAPGSSGGINLSTLSRNVGGPGGGLGKVQVARASSALGGIGRPGQDRPLSGDSVGMSRTDEEIQIVFDRYKAAFYRMYNRELRKDPTLRGQMVLKLTIEADGSVSMCVLQASDMNAAELSAQVVDRVKTINFGAKEGISAITILYPIDFLPAA